MLILGNLLRNKCNFQTASKAVGNRAIDCIVASNRELNNSQDVLYEFCDYSPFRIKLRGKCFNSGDYRYGFNGQEKERELNPSFTSAEYWMYDGKLGRRWNLDPKPQINISDYACFANNPIRLTDYYGLAPGDPAPGEKKGDGNSYVKKSKNSKNLLLLSPSGKTHEVGKNTTYTFSNGKVTDGQQKKAGVWSYSDGDTGKNFMWDNVNGKFVENTSNEGGGENSFPIFGNSGTTYAGENNPTNNKTGDDDYSQPPQNIADAGGFFHDKRFDNENLRGSGANSNPKSKKPNFSLVKHCQMVIDMYNKKEIDPYTGAPVSEKTYKTAVLMEFTFIGIEMLR